MVGMHFAERWDDSLEMGAEPKTIQGVLRHASMSTTMNIYVLPPSEASREDMKNLSESILPMGLE